MDSHKKESKYFENGNKTLPKKKIINMLCLKWYIEII